MKLLVITLWRGYLIMAKKKVFQISNALTEGLEETINAAQSYAGELRIDIIPIKRIEVDPNNPRDLQLNFEDIYHGLSPADANYIRKSEELNSLQTIANSIREQGIINPIVVYKFGDKYRLIAGERRTLASLVAGKHEIQAKILDSRPNELKISLLQWIENVERADLTLWERLTNLEKILAIYTSKKGCAIKDITLNELSHLISCTKPHAMNYKAVLMADDHLKNLIRDNQIRNLEKAALIANIQSQPVKQQAIEACLTGATLKKLKMMAERENSPTPIRPKEINKKGRRAEMVNFGVTKNVDVAKAIIDAIFQNQLVNEMTDLPKINWSDYKSISDAFNLLLRKLEQIHA